MIRILISFLFFINLLFSDVILKAPSSFISGEALKFVIEYSGSEEPVFPKIDKIDGFRVQSGGRANQISIINGNRSQTISQTYILYPNKDITIPSFEIKTSNNLFKTDPKKVIVNIPSKTKSNDFDLTLKVDKNSLYVGESFILTLKFKYRLGVNVLNMELNQPNFDGFWVKPLGKSRRGVEAGFETHTLQYLLFPQRIGKQQIDPISISIALPDNSGRGYSFFRTPAKIKKFYSNSLELDIKALPENLKLIGKYKIDASVDKTKVKLGEAVSFKIEISGNGNLDDIQDLKLDIPNATIYENKPDKKFEFKDGKYSGVYTKSFSIVANSSFKIEPVILEYFDEDEKVKKVIQTKSYDIEVLGVQPAQKEVVLQKSEPIEKVEKKIVVQSVSNKEKILFFIFGLVCGILLIIILYYFKNQKKSKKEDDKPLVKTVKSTSNKNELLKTLAPYLNKDRELDTLIYSLEKIDEKMFKTIKKEIVAKVKKMNF